MTADARDLVMESLATWAPSWPRKVTTHQEHTGSPAMAAELLIDAQQRDDVEPFISTYSFPDGHTKENNVPRIDTLFIDFDFDSGDYESGSGNREAWRRDLSHLLVRARRVAELLVERDATGWRAALSGHKGVHLFIDFPALPRDIASFEEYLAGMESYSSALIDDIINETSLSDLHTYVDVTSSDLGRLCRVPNTLHGGATASFGEERYCVPVSIEELASLSVSEYETLTQKPRSLSIEGRQPNPEVADILERYIKAADTSRTRRSYTDVDYSRVQKYKECANDSITLNDVKFLTSDRPCVWEFHKRSDKFDYGYQSHAMELFCVRELIEHDVPIEVIQQFLSTSEKYDPEWTANFIKRVIARNYNRFSIEWLHENAPEFCKYDHCSICERVLNNK